MSQDDLAEKENNWVHTPAPRLRTDPPWIEATYPEKERTFEVFKANARYINYFNKRTYVTYKLNIFSDFPVGVRPHVQQWQG